MDTAVRHEGDEAESRETAQGLANRCPADLELLLEVLLPENASRRNLAGDDRLLERERDVVGLRSGFGHLSTLQEPVVGGKR